MKKIFLVTSTIIFWSSAQSGQIELTIKQKVELVNKEVKSFFNHQDICLYCSTTYPGQGKIAHVFKKHSTALIIKLDNKLHPFPTRDYAHIVRYVASGSFRVYYCKQCKRFLSKSLEHMKKYHKSKECARDPRMKIGFILN